MTQAIEPRINGIVKKSLITRCRRTRKAEVTANGNREQGTKTSATSVILLRVFIDQLECSLLLNFLRAPRTDNILDRRDKGHPDEREFGLRRTSCRDQSRIQEFMECSWSGNAGGAFIPIVIYNVHEQKLAVVHEKGHYLWQRGDRRGGRMSQGISTHTPRPEPLRRTPHRYQYMCKWRCPHRIRCAERRMGGDRNPFNNSIRHSKTLGSWI